jgi:hypothetical protein
MKLSVDVIVYSWNTFRIKDSNVVNALREYVTYVYLTMCVCYASRPRGSYESYL